MFFKFSSNKLKQEKGQAQIPYEVAQQIVAFFVPDFLELEDVRTWVCIVNFGPKLPKVCFWAGGLFS